MPDPKKIYIIGSLRNPRVTEVARRIRAEGFNAFDDWFGAGPEADDCWQRYEEERGREYWDALYAPHPRNILLFDRKHLDDSAAGILVLPAGRSAHIELGYLIGQGKNTFVLFHEQPERWDVMYGLATRVARDIDELVGYVRKYLS